MPDQVVEMRAVGGLDAEDFATLAASARAAARQGMQLRLLLDLRDIGAGSFEAIRERLLYDTESDGGIEKLAVITDNPWTARWVQVTSLLSRVDARSFTGTERLDALEWLEAT
jgi:hypothetical protein